MNFVSYHDFDKQTNGNKNITVWTEVAGKHSMGCWCVWKSFIHHTMV